MTDEGRNQSNAVQELCPTVAAWSKKPKHSESKKRVGGPKEREAVVIEDDPDTREFLKDRWFEIFGSKQ